MKLRNLARLGLVSLLGSTACAQTPTKIEVPNLGNLEQQVIAVTKDPSIKQNSYYIAYNKINEKGTSTGEHIITPPILKEHHDHQELQWQIINMPTQNETKIGWEPEV